MDVAVKVLRASGLSAGDFAAETKRVEREARLLRLANLGGANRLVVSQLGIARGAPDEAWRARLGADLGVYVSRDAAGAAASHAAAGGGATGEELIGLVMEWQPGGSLYDRLYGPVRWAARTPARLLLLERVAEGVHRLHAAQPESLVHGDLKSANILLSGLGDAAEPRIADFGLARLRAAVASVAGMSTARAAGVSVPVGGTPYYQAPEMFPSAEEDTLEASRTTDVYALATLCWEVLVGELPHIRHRGKVVLDGPSRAMAQRVGARLDFARLPEDVPDALRALLSRGVALDRSLRPTTNEICEGLRTAREHLESGRYDAFLSHSWDAGGTHAPVTRFVRRALRAEGLHIWVDEDQLGHNLAESMRAGIKASAAFVALVSRRYAASRSCMLELREAVALGRPVISCLVEPDTVGGRPQVRLPTLNASLQPLST
jgi:serine/threonine protein kinase